ncbi:DUF3617 family protein [Phenylobacterium sp.]|uniref:DUF3617 domain-containing protein n=1 Tax=Phenylobacterium sp. TaxID=1871053 RepID=UPI002727B522|nr:DUF3617 family protein [Phenylobacterium sp.]MDO8801513.1 hypothetical protein [Phenylobacterium sp.]
MRLGVMLAAVALLGVSACDKPAEKTDAQAPAPAFTPSQTPPARKPGLWEQRVSTGDFVQVSRICLDADTDAKISFWGSQATRDMCEKNVFSARVAGGYQFSSVCDMGSGGKTTTSGTATGDFNSKYLIEAESSTVGAAAPQMNGLHKVTVEAAWQGACPAGYKPGDMSLPGGIKINILELPVPPKS